MRKFKIHFLLIAIIALASSCKKQDNANLDEVLYVRYDGADMPVYVKGNGTAKKVVLIIHGGPGGSGLEYRFGDYYKPMEEAFAVAYYDQRGSGSSQGSYEQSTVTVAQMADDLHQVVLTLKAHYGNDMEVYLLGHSWGGMVGTAYLIRPEATPLVSGWIESDGAHDILRLNQLARRMFISIGTAEINAGNNVEQWQEMVTYCENISDTTNPSPDNWSNLNRWGFEAERMLSDVHEGNSASIGQLLSSVFFSASSPITSGLQGVMVNNALFAEVEEAQLTDQLHKIQVPSLMIYGKYDFVTPSGLGMDAFDLIGHWDKTFLLFEHSGHSPMDNEAARFSSVVIDFVQQH